MASAFKTESVYPRLAYSADRPEGRAVQPDFAHAVQRHVCSESCDERYHVARAIEETDKAQGMTDGAERRVHENLAAMHAKAAELARQA